MKPEWAWQLAANVILDEVLRMNLLRLREKKTCASFVDTTVNYLCAMKQQLLSHCIELAIQKVEALETELNSNREAATSESKSSAGDKHETGRAMMHLEQEKLQRQLAEAQTIVAELGRIDASIEHEKAGLGSLLKTNNGSFLIAAGLGKIRFEETRYFVVSAQAPIAKQFLGKIVGETVTLNGSEYTILSIE